ncbi:MAG: serine hydrolase [Saprospiraceae bacterium]
MLCLLLSINSCIGQSSAETEEISVSKAAQIDEIISLYADYGGFNGAAAVSHRDRVIYKKGFGFANMEWDIPNDIDTKFQIASITKSFTAMLVMQLVEDKTLDLEESISTYLPNYPKEVAEKVTIHHLLSHTSGIPNVKGENKAFHPEDMVGKFVNEPLAFDPGTKFDYSNSGYTLLGYLIETVTQRSYQDVLTDKIFKPLGMTNSGFYRNRTLIKNMSSGYNRWYGDYFDVDKTDESSAYSAGGIYSTVEDMMLWNEALRHETLLPQEFMNKIFTRHSTDGDGFYGYGWEFKRIPVGNTNETIETVGHSGMMDGYRTSFIRIPSTNSSIVLFSNTSYAFLNALNKSILGILNDRPYDDPLKPLALFFTRVVEQEGIDEGISFYRLNKDESEYYVSEEELIVTGYKFLQSGNPDYALKIFALSIEIFPASYNPYDSYAEALMTTGQNREAIEYYRKSLELKPDNINAERMIEKLQEKIGRDD